MRGGEFSGGDVGSQSISAGLVPKGEPRYFTTFVKNNDNDDTGAHGLVANFSEMRTTNLIPRTSAYQIAVEKASIDTKAIPSFIAPVDPTSSDKNKLLPVVGLQMKWTGSLYPSTFWANAGSIEDIPPNPDQPSESLNMSVGGSSLPVKYSRGPSSFRPPQVLSGFLQGPAAVQGVMEVYPYNNPKSTFWQGIYSYNPSVNRDTPTINSVFTARPSVKKSFSLALQRSFGTWKDLGLIGLGADFIPTLIGASQPNRWQVSIENLSSISWSGYDANWQIYIGDVTASPADPNFNAILPLLTGFYPSPGDYAQSGNDIVTTLSQDASDALNLYVKQFGLGSFPSLYAKVYARDMTPDNSAVPFVDVNFNENTQVVSTTSIYATLPSTDYANGAPYFQFGFDSVIASYSSPIVLDFTTSSADGVGLAATYSTIGDTTKNNPQKNFSSAYVDNPPSLDDFLFSALCLGFIPGTTFNIPYEGTSFYMWANRPIAPPFLTSLTLSSYKNLIWKPNDEYAASDNPEPGSQYYYGYGDSYMTDIVVNDAFQSCITDSNDSYFDSFRKPQDAIALITPPITSLSDLSLSSQLYCMTFYNSCNVTQVDLNTVLPYSSSGQYVFGSPVQFANPNVNAPVNLLYVANRPSNPRDPQIPVPFANSEYWLYCGPFIYNTAQYGKQYGIGYGTEVFTQYGAVFAGGVAAITSPAAAVAAANVSAYIIRNAPLGAATKSQLTTLRPTPVVGTAAPIMKLNSEPGDHGNIFQLKLDTYGYGTYDSANSDNFLRAYARDSWGMINGPPNSFNPGRVYDEYMLVQGNTAFRDLFRGFPSKCLQYIDPVSGVQSAYWSFEFILDATATFQPSMPSLWENANISEYVIPSSGGLPGSGALLVPILPSWRTTQTQGITHKPRLRNTDPTIYYWTFSSSETSRYSGWDPVQSIVIEGVSVPVSQDDMPVSAPAICNVTGPANGTSRMILAEFFTKRNTGEDTIQYEPQVLRDVYLATASDLKYFAYKIYWRNKFTGELVPLLLSANGSALVIFRFTPKD